MTLWSGGSEPAAQSVHWLAEPGRVRGKYGKLKIRPLGPAWCAGSGASLVSNSERGGGIAAIVAAHEVQAHGCAGK